jgi:hypothetical protein
MKTQIRIFIALIVLFTISCDNTENSINDIWVGNYQYSIYFDTIYNYPSPLDYLIDLSNPDTAVIKYLPGSELKMKWSIDDSLLTIDTTTYRIITLTKDSLVYSPFMAENPKPLEKPIEKDEIQIVPVKDQYYIFRRVKRDQPKKSSADITELISNKLFLATNKYQDTLGFGDYLYIMDNGVAIMKMTYKNKNDVLLQDECWDIINYKGYLFIGFFHNWDQDNGSYFNHAYQLTSISDTGFAIEDFPPYRTIEYEATKENTNDSTYSAIIGKWISINTINGFQGWRVSKRLLEQGLALEYSDTLEYEFYEDSMRISFNGVRPYTGKWRLSPDNSIFVFEFRKETPRFKGYHVKYANIKSADSDSLVFDLYNDMFYTDLEKPKTILINHSQRLRKID